MTNVPSHCFECVENNIKTKIEKSRLPNESLTKVKYPNTYKAELGLTLAIEEDAS